MQRRWGRGEKEQRNETGSISLSTCIGRDDRRTLFLEVHCLNETKDHVEVTGFYQASKN